MKTVRLANGFTFNCMTIDRWMSSSLILQTIDFTFLSAVEIFSNSEATKRITVIGEDEDIVYQGFTVLKSIQKEPFFGDAGLTIILEK